ncbi:MAG: hypothetical protein A3B89_04115 [Candidatus Buchananbacteria bacterium RIFCSPHIGHO2_02_FULL_40_13]|uniref:Rhodanese domain-containing protein n=1 Tax=Candidatus Buchananbacteria bacterium RIFCSPLOWO2_01_FULL_39_33 TaxID=1797543 RepID=A0A1G1YKR5_9BACT|nr:MAG: hypothetical protein A2820_01820 [Candidatus Buchananbacteria bacterium RIFCSPHIGHO2_01_FULL_40_35]OGY50865.1 MAG: hypothetical protein A3B89_04115 [Candidatus Buchananbacteria bacterium RIFCSPHIGHO2_02_FULL_40_13]OGY52932.1 MAG: hypothetical protein A3A02_04290 [Candidatus Buchananbacteria bacterium RIFCSPLOWO2_01_FULL_39_33]
MAKIITTEDLRKKLASGVKDFYLVDVLSANSYRAQHIPGAQNIVNGPDFLKRFEKEIAAPKDAEIIVYCASATCSASVQAADILEKANYTKVIHYKDGLAGWQNTGYHFEGEAT